MASSTKRKQPSTTTETNNSTVQLLLHTVDGAIPYLTPHLLNKCFPVDQVKDYLQLGIAVRDACISPVFGDRKHPIGHSFDQRAQVDPWLLPYPRVTCPTFDLEEDAIRYSKPKIADETTLGSSNPHVQVWTDSGRLPLTNEAYMKAVEGLESQTNVTLFDVCSIRAKDKRRLQATQRTVQWKRELLQKTKEPHSNTNTWASCLLVSSNREFPVEQEQFTELNDALENQQIRGVAFTGCSTTEPDFLEQSVQKLQSSHDFTLAVLSVKSLPHFLQCYQAGINVFGVKLPAKWARTKKAFSIDFRNYSNFKKAKQAESIEEVADLDSDGCRQVGKEWIKDARPILNGCACMACQEHSRAYLYHLVLTKELLLHVLLFIHNLHHLLELCRELKKARQEGTQKDIVEHMQNQLGKMEEGK